MDISEEQTVDAGKFYSAKQAAEIMDMRHAEVIRRINRGDIVAERVGWNWIIPGKSILLAMKKDWYTSRRT